MGKGASSLETYLVAETWHRLTFPTPATSHVSYSSQFKVLHKVCAGLTLGGSAAFTQSLSVPSCLPHDLVRRPTSCSHISSSSREWKTQHLRIWLFCCFILIVSFTHPTPKWSQGFPGGSLLRNPPASRRCASDPWVWEDPLEKEMATHSSILAWRILWTEEPGGLQSMGCKESDMTEHICLWLQLCTSKGKRRPN